MEERTRDKKVILSPDQILAAHKQIADEFGNQAERVVTEARHRRKHLAQERPAGGRHQQVREAITFARDKSFEREAVIGERALYVDALRRGMGEMTYPEVRASFEARIASGEFRQVEDSARETGRRFTTAATIKAENEIVQKVREGQNRAPQIMSIGSAVPLTETRPHFNAAQKRGCRGSLDLPRRGTRIAGTRGQWQNLRAGIHTSGSRTERLHRGGFCADIARCEAVSRCWNQGGHVATLSRGRQTFSLAYGARRELLPTYGGTPHWPVRAGLHTYWGFC